jgi:hypothetical protein
MLDENLVGYLLKALDAASEREVEIYLQSHPEAQTRLDLLRKAFEPLEADRDLPEPPRGLRVRTLARIAEYRCSAPIRMPQAPAIRSFAPRRSWWTRADVLVAASILLLVLPFIPPGIVYIQQQHKITVCQDNLRRFHQAFVNYGDQYNGALPMVEERAPRNFAGVFVPVLHDAGVLGSDVSVACPANGYRPADKTPTLKEMDELFASNLAEFEQSARHLSGCYAYSLGYRDAAGQLHGICRSDGDRLPIMADRPPFDQKACSEVVSGNSPNHCGRGQNVLFMGGYAKFETTRNVGIDGDDIYLNRHNLPAAGLDPLDTVLGSSGFKPSVPGMPEK